MMDAENNSTFSSGKDHSAWIAIYSEACLSKKTVRAKDARETMIE